MARVGFFATDDRRAHLRVQDIDVLLTYFPLLCYLAAQLVYFFQKHPLGSTEAEPVEADGPDVMVLDLPLIEQFV